MSKIKILSTILLLTISSISILNVQTNPNYSRSMIRVTFKSFPYLDDPAGISYNSYGQLGDLSAYVLRIYAKAALNPYISAMEQSEKMLGVGNISGVTVLPDSKIFGKILVVLVKR